MNTIIQIQKMARTLAELRSCLDVYEGLFKEQENVEMIHAQFKEIGKSLQSSLTVNLIIGCAALFTDPHETTIKRQVIENMSFPNLHNKYIDKYSIETTKLKNKIDEIINEENMNLKNFRNKHVGHFDLQVKLGNNNIPRTITIDTLKNLITDGSKLLHLITRDAKLLPTGQSIDYYTPIPETRSTKVFLNRLLRT